MWSRHSWWRFWKIKKKKSRSIVRNKDLNRRPFDSRLKRFAVFLSAISKNSGWKVEFKLLSFNSFFSSSYQSDEYEPVPEGSGAHGQTEGHLWDDGLWDYCSRFKSSVTSCWLLGLNEPDVQIRIFWTSRSRADVSKYFENVPWLERRSHGLGLILWSLSGLDLIQSIWRTSSSLTVSVRSTWTATGREPMWRRKTPDQDLEIRSKYLNLKVVKTELREEKVKYNERKCISNISHVHLQTCSSDSDRTEALWS